MNWSVQPKVSVITGIHYILTQSIMEFVSGVHYKRKFIINEFTINGLESIANGNNKFKNKNDF